MILFQFEKVYGEEKTGFAFRCQYKGDQQSFQFADFYNFAKRNDFFSAAFFPWAEKTIQYNNFDVYYDPARSAAKSAKFALNYGK